MQIGALFFVAAAAAAASSGGPAKLFVATAHGVAFADYPSMERCEAAREALVAKWRHEQDASSPQGYHIVEYAPLTAVCIPA